MDSDNMVVFTGAGMSTESGISDFRGPHGIWKKYRPVELQQFLSSREARTEYWRRKIEFYPEFKNAAPHKGHLALAELFNLDFLKYVVTQNIDGLHQAAGIPDEKVIELHGTGRYISCLECGKRFEWEEILPYFNADGTLDDSKDTPVCDYCQGFLKPATISFGQAMPEKETAEAFIRAAESDLFVAIGSSLQVYPAAAIPQEAAKSGSYFVIINNESTPLDPLADLVITGQAGDILEQTVLSIKQDA
jgi:NAD-dependent deacetylase